ncbi:MAG TPA: hypothetical protein VJ951_11130, partial [Bacteroidales bacterium]|nr:hypothetical protein [Bacteroidales bacterium]
MKKTVNYTVPIIVFILISYIYFSPLMEGKRLEQHDVLTFKGQAKEIFDYKKQTGEETLWTNSMFGGMPAYLIHVNYKGNLISHLNKILLVGARPASQLFLLLLGGYILFLALRINPWLSLVGAIAIAFSSYNFIIIMAGHNTKVIAIAYAAPVIAGAIMTFRGKRLLGAALTGIFLTLQIYINHPQITYYTLIILLFYGISELIFAYREGRLKTLFTNAGLLVAVMILAVLSNYNKLATVLEYNHYSMRTTSELTMDEGDKTEGLNLSYATAWSYGVDETFTLLIPGFKGGSSTYNLGKNSETYEALAQLDRNFANNFVQNANLYWGTQTFTSGPVYLGAVVMFLFVLGMFILKGRYKWWILAVAVLGIMLSWGRNFMPLTEFFMHNIPGYNKFRTVSMTLVIPQLVIPILAMLTLKKVLSNKIEKPTVVYGLKWATIITGGLALIFVLIPSLAGNFSSPNDMRNINAMAGGNEQVRQALTNTLIPALEADRKSILQTDALRSLIFILLSGGLIYLLRIKEQKMSMNLVIALFGILIIADLWPVNKRFLNDDNFVKKTDVEVPYTPNTADKMILESPGLNERVLNLTASPFQDARTSYFHQSIGGYHGAKTRLIQDLIDTRLMDEISLLTRALQGQDPMMRDSVMSQLNVLNMLNTKFIIINPNAAPLVNPYAMGNAWFVNKVNAVGTANAALTSVSRIDLSTEAVTDSVFLDALNNTTFEKTPEDRIQLVDYQPNKLTYKSSSTNDGFAVFSEVYYPKGWNVTIDGEATE